MILGFFGSVYLNWVYLVVTGAIAQATHSFVPALLAGAAIAFVFAMSYLFLVRDPIPQQLASAERTAP
jgi:hypothetical protein